MPRKLKISSSQTTGKKYTQIKISELFSTSAKLRCDTTSKIKLNTRVRKQLFTEEVIVVDSDSESECQQLPSSQTSSQKTTQEMSLNKPITGLLKTPEKCKPRILQSKSSESNIVLESFANDTEKSSQKTAFEVSLNKPIADILKTPEKCKPRILQSKLSESNISPENDTDKPCSQESTASDETIFYDYLQEIQNSENHLDFQSPAAKLLHKVDETCERTKTLSLAFKRTIFPISPTGSPQKRNRSPKKSPRKHNIQPVEEVVNPRVVNMITKIIKYVFSQPHLKILFTKEEILVLSKFYDMPEPEYHFLCYKLFTRLPKWYNVLKLSENINLKFDTGRIIEMHRYLGENGFVYTDYSMEPLTQLLNLLPTSDIKEICDSFRLKIKSTTKPQLIENLINNTVKQTTLTLTKNTNQILKERIHEKLGLCVKLSDQLYDLFNRLHILYSLGSPDLVKPHDLYQFLDRVSCGDIVIPEHVVDTSLIFESRDEFLNFAKAAEYKNELINAFDNKNRTTMIEICKNIHAQLKQLLGQRIHPKKPNYLLRFTPGSKYASALSFGAKHLTPNCPSDVKDWLELLLSQDIYCQRKRGDWYNQMAMIHIRYFKNSVEGAQTIINALKDEKLTEPAKHELSARGLAIKNSKKNKVSTDIHDQIVFNLVEPPDLTPFPTSVIDANAISGNETGRKRTYVVMQNNGEKHFFSVENIALNHYSRNGFPQGIHCEGSLIASLFFMLFWDIIYDTRIPSAFISEIQYAPTDLFTEDFYRNRQKAIDERIEEIETLLPEEKIINLLVHNWELHSHKKSFAIRNIVEDTAQLCEIFDCIGRKVLAQICKRLAMNFGQYHSGMPDLFVWNANEKKCRFVEVKGEKDKLSMKQKMWLDYLRKVGAEIDVCLVHTIGSKGNERARAKRLRTEPS